MAGRGPAPKDPTKRRRRNAGAPETTIVPDDELRGPEGGRRDLANRPVHHNDGAPTWQRSVDPRGFLRAGCVAYLWSGCQCSSAITIRGDVRSAAATFRSPISLRKYPSLD